MKIKLLTFGVINEIVENKQISNEQIKSTDDLLIILENKYPEIKNLNYKISVNRKLINGNTILNDNDEVAVLPPFAGG